MDGLRVLVVEDSCLMAAVLEDLLRAAGAVEVAVAPSVSTALEVLRGATVDLACLDIDLGSETSFPVADELALRRIPFVFISGRPRDNIPDLHRDRPFVCKLTDEADLIAVCLQAARSSRSPGLVDAA